MASRVMLADNSPIRDYQIQALLDECGFLFSQPKIDGMRVHINDDCLPASRSGKIFKHKPLQAWTKAHPSLRGLDGEITPSHEYTEEGFRDAMSSIRSEDGTREFTYWIFDHTGYGDSAYSHRLGRLEDVLATHGQYQETPDYHCRLMVTPTKMVHTLQEVQDEEQANLLLGWEGTMLRHPRKPYKYGRSTNRGGELVKLKRFEDAEAIVVGYEPWQRNDNEPTIDTRGYQVRSSHQENKVDLDMLGVLKCELLSDRSIKFGVGVMRGVSHAERRRLWEVRDSLLGRIFKFKYQGYSAGYDAPRCPVFLNWRSAAEF